MNMSGMVMRVMRKRTLDFSAVMSGQAQDIVIAQGIDVSEWREAALMVRTHVNSFTGATGKIEILAQLEGRTDEDPGILFATTSFFGVVTIDNTVTAPAYVVQT